MSLRPERGGVNPRRFGPTMAQNTGPEPSEAGAQRSDDYAIDDVVAAFAAYAAAARSGRFSEAVGPGRRLRRYGFHIRFVRPEGQGANL